MIIFEFYILHTRSLKMCGHKLQKKKIKIIWKLFERVFWSLKESHTGHESLFPGILTLFNMANSLKEKIYFWHIHSMFFLKEAIRLTNLRVPPYHLNSLNWLILTKVVKNLTLNKMKTTLNFILDVQFILFHVYIVFLRPEFAIKCQLEYW